MSDQQPMPTPGHQDVTPIARQTFNDLLNQREQMGIKTYGTTLQTHNGRDAGLDAREELIDAYQYVTQLELENVDLKAENARLTALLAVRSDDVDADWAADRAIVGPLVHQAWAATKVSHGFANHSWRPREGEPDSDFAFCAVEGCKLMRDKHHTDMVPFNQLSQKIQDYDYNTGQAVYPIGWHRGYSTATEKLCPPPQKLLALAEFLAKHFPSDSNEVELDLRKWAYAIAEAQGLDLVEVSDILTDSEYARELEGLIRYLVAELAVIRDIPQDDDPLGQNAFRAVQVAKRALKHFDDTIKDPGRTLAMCQCLTWARTPEMGGDLNGHHPHCSAGGATF